MQASQASKRYLSFIVYIFICMISGETTEVDLLALKVDNSYFPNYFHQFFIGSFHHLLVNGNTLL
jgi:hypothetical protein